MRALEPSKPETSAADAAAERYLELWERNQSEIARRGPPPAAPAPR